MIAIDAETFLIRRWRPLPPVVCLSYATRMFGGVQDVIHHTEAHRVLKHWLIDQEFTTLNGAYDFGCFAATWPDLLPAIFDAYREGRIHDVQLRQQLIDIATGRVLADDELRKYGLAHLYRLIFDREMPGPGKGADSWRLRYGELHGVPLEQWPAEAREYPICDATSTLEIHDEQEAKAGHLLKDDAAQAYSYFTLGLAAARGMRTDATRVAEFKRQQEEVRSLLQPELVQVGLLEPVMKGRKPNKVRVGWTLKQQPARDRIVTSCIQYGIEPLMTEDKRKNPTTEFQPQVSFDRTACYWARDPVMLRRADYVTADKMLSTYLPFLEAGTVGPVTSRMNLAATGRTTSSTPREPLVGSNMQTAPRKVKRVKRYDEYKPGESRDLTLGQGLVTSELGVRECFQARPKHVYLSGDFSGAEMHALAQVCYWKLGHSTLGEVLKSGKDPHLYLACFLLGGDASNYDEVVKRYKKDDLDVDQARQDGKRANFGFGGAMGVPRFLRMLLKEGQVWAPERGKRLKQSWLEAYPEMPEYFAICKEELGPEGKAMIAAYMSGRLRKVRSLAAICNGFFQQLVADAAKAAINEVIRHCYVVDGELRDRGCFPVNFIHDELVLEMLFSHHHSNNVAAHVFKSIMEDTFNRYVPDYPTKVDVVLSYTLSKRMKPVIKNGVLVPWLL